jgi:hypothetical protein
LRSKVTEAPLLSPETTYRKSARASAPLELELLEEDPDEELDEELDEEADDELEEELDEEPEEELPDSSENAEAPPQPGSAATTSKLMNSASACAK